jgi:hypothetical protein
LFIFSSRNGIGREERGGGRKAGRETKKGMQTKGGVVKRKG